jgi:hypothetical protein
VNVSERKMKEKKCDENTGDKGRETGEYIIEIWVFSY